MFRWISDRWYARQRAFDLKYLWPQCYNQASCRDEAVLAFAMHALRDPAWLRLGDDLQDTLNNLPPPEGATERGAAYGCAAERGNKRGNKNASHDQP